MYPTYHQTSIFFTPSIPLRNSGPRYSNPVLEKGITSVIRRGGNGGIFHEPTSCRQQTTHFCITCRTTAQGICFLFDLEFEIHLNEGFV